MESMELVNLLAVLRYALVLCREVIEVPNLSLPNASIVQNPPQTPSEVGVCSIGLQMDIMADRTTDGLLSKKKKDAINQKGNG